MDHADLYGRTALSWAVTKGDFDETAKLLIERGADVNRADSDGFTPLMRAVLMEHLRCVDALIRDGADPNIVPPERGKNAFQVAAERGSDRLKKLIEILQRNQQ